MLKTERLILVPFDMKHLQDYFNGFNEEITKFQWPDPFANMNFSMKRISEMKQALSCCISLKMITKSLNSSQND